MDGYLIDRRDGRPHAEECAGEARLRAGACLVTERLG